MNQIRNGVVCLLCRHLNSLTNNIKTIIKKLNNNSTGAIAIFFFNGEWLFLEVGIWRKAHHILFVSLRIYVPVEYSLGNKKNIFYSPHLYINYVDCQKIRRIINHKVQHDASHQKSEWKNIFFHTQI